MLVLPEFLLAKRADALPRIAERAIESPAFRAGGHFFPVFLAKIVAAALTAHGAFRANRLAADIAFSETPDADMPLAARADGRMARTGHLAADFAFAHVMNAERLAAFGALKGAFAADLLTAERARRGIRTPDMLIAAGAGDEAMKTDRAMAEIAFNHVNMAGDVAALRALRRATAAKMLAAV